MQLLPGIRPRSPYPSGVPSLVFSGHVPELYASAFPKTPPISGPAAPSDHDKAQPLRGPKRVSERRARCGMEAAVSGQESTAGAASGRTSSGRTHSRGSAAECPSRSPGPGGTSGRP
ncbi:unnamed protein product [Coccothraustes coccothraustes]